MAEEEVVIVEGDDDGGLNLDIKPTKEQKQEGGTASATTTSEGESAKEPKFTFKLDRKNIILLAGAVVMLIAAIVFTVYLVSHRAQDDNSTATGLLFGGKSYSQDQAAKRVAYDRNDIERLIKKAKALYDSGDKENALKLYKEISMFNESISSYNLGVAKMNEKDYSSAIRYFKDSLENGDNEFPAAINATLCAIKLGDKKQKEHFLELAEQALPKYVSSPLYSYYYTLLQYYSGNYFEALASINAKTSNYFDKEVGQLAPRLYLIHDDPINSLDYLLKIKNKDNLAQGLLYARDGRYIDAEQSLVKALGDGADSVKTNMALALIYLKTGACVSASNAITESVGVSEINATNMYPIKVVLRSSAFDSDAVQQKLASEFLYDSKTQNQILFYYAPFKLFNPDKSIASIKKGQAGILINDNKGGAEYLSGAAKTSRANAEIVRGIEYAINGRVWLANKTFKALEKQYQTHSILLYNLALTYAQLGDMRLANKYFTRSYNLDQRNPEAGIFAIITAKEMGIDFEKIKIPLDEHFTEQKTTGKMDEITMLYNIATDATYGNTEWMLKSEKKSPFACAIAVMLALKTNKMQSAIEFSNALLRQSPKDIVASAIGLHLADNGKDVKTFAKKVQSFMLRGDYDKNSIFYGPDIAYRTYINLARISGLVYIAEQLFDEKLRTEQYDRVQLLKAWSVSKVFMKKFDEANKGLSEVIFKNDNLNPEILFYAGTSAIASGKTAEAISFFELSKMAEKLNPESLYILGMLYQEAGSLKVASGSYKQIKDVYTSQFFDFELKPKLY